ncbi:MAG: InlB B-repeat-containing protein [Erysipelotrichaceae bacterium]
MTVVGGLIGQVEAYTIISEVKIEVDVNIQSNWEDSSSFIVGGLMGYAKDSQLSKAIVTGSFIVNDLQTSSSSTFLGGLIGYSEKMDVIDASVTADITVQPYMGDNIVGGAIGFSGGTSSYNQISYKGIISTSGFSAGGLIGAAFTDSEILDSTSITESYVEADVSALLSAGGILGIAAGTIEITDSSYDGALTDSLSKGGIVGMIMDANTVISRCFSLGTIQFYLPYGSAFGSGGIYGTNNGEVTLTDVYSRMDFSFENPNKVGLMDAGELPWVGGIGGINTDNDQFSNVYYAGHIILGESNAYNDPLVYYDPDSSPLLAQNLYFDHDLSPLDSLFGSPKTTTEMKLESTFVGFDFEEVWIILPYINDGYPTFRKSLDEVTYHNGTETSIVYVKRGSKIEKASDPTNTDYIFGGWYTDETYSTPWNFETGLVQSDIALYAKWTAKITDTGDSSSLYGLLFLMGSVLVIGNRKRKEQ